MDVAPANSYAPAPLKNTTTHERACCVCLVTNYTLIDVGEFNKKNH